MFDLIQMAVLERCKDFPLVQNHIFRVKTGRTLAERLRRETELSSARGAFYGIAHEKTGTNGSLKLNTSKVQGYRIVHT